MNHSLSKALIPGVMLLAMVSAPAAADDQESCFSNDPDRILAACGRIISQGQAPSATIGRAHASRGWALIRKNKYNQAIVDYTKAINIDPQIGHYYFYRGSAFDKTAQYDQAIADYTQSIRLDPEKVGAYVNRGNVHAREGRRDQAIDDWMKALDLKPTLEVARKNLERLGVLVPAVAQPAANATSGFAANPKPGATELDLGGIDDLGTLD